MCVCVFLMLKRDFLSCTRMWQSSLKIYFSIEQHSSFPPSIFQYHFPFVIILRCATVKSFILIRHFASRLIGNSFFFLFIIAVRSVRLCRCRWQKRFFGLFRRLIWLIKCDKIRSSKLYYHSFIWTATSAPFCLSESNWRLNVFARASNRDK